MLVARAYAVLDAVVVEVSCVHPSTVGGSHLVIREERRGMAPSRRAMVKALRDVMELALLLEPAQSLEECDRQPEPLEE